MIFTALTIAAALAHAQPPDISGSYRLDLVIASKANVPVFGEAEIMAQTTMLAQISPDGQGGYTQRHITCSVSPRTSLKVAQTTIPPSFIAPMSEKVYPVVLTERPDGRWTYRADFGPQHIGFRPELSGGMPPAEATHPGVVDWEGDGHPGATILLQVPVFGQVEVYITQLAHTRIDGVLVESGGASGKVEVVALEQRSIGAKPMLFAANPAVTQMPGQSRFILTPTTATTCQQLPAL
ncbi:MAG: hypothetical protein ACI8S6_003515 [Myxococcota bacterium]|jgi:hypothetical protein